MNLNSDSLSKNRAKRSSSETLIKRSAPNTNRNGVLINGAKIFPELISDLLTELIGKIGENITIKRFVRYQIGES